jgi:hypothetical protein
MGQLGSDNLVHHRNVQWAPEGVVAQFNGTDIFAGLILEFD